MHRAAHGLQGGGQCGDLRGFSRSVNAFKYDESSAIQIALTSQSRLLFYFTTLLRSCQGERGRKWGVPVFFIRRRMKGKVFQAIYALILHRSLSGSRPFPVATKKQTPLERHSKGRFCKNTVYFERDMPYFSYLTFVFKKSTKLFTAP